MRPITCCSSHGKLYREAVCITLIFSKVRGSAHADCAADLYNAACGRGEELALPVERLTYVSHGQLALWLAQKYVEACAAWIRHHRSWLARAILGKVAHSYHWILTAIATPDEECSIVELKI